MAYQAPSSYKEWAELLDILKSGTDDTAVIDAMREGSLAWQSGVAERFSTRLLDVVNSRLNRIVDVLNRDMRNARGEERSLVCAFIGARRGYKALLKMIDIPAIPDELRSQCRNLIFSKANSMQHSLEDSAARRSPANRLTSGGMTGHLASIVRNNPVNLLD